MLVTTNIHTLVDKLLITLGISLEGVGGLWQVVGPVATPICTSQRIQTNN